MAVALAFGSSEELVQLFAARGISLPARLVWPTIVAMVLAAAFGAGAFGANPSASSPMAHIGWPAMTAMLAIVVLFIREMALYEPHGGAIERLTAAVFTIFFLGLPLACVVGLRLLHADADAAENVGRPLPGMLPLLSLVAVAKAGDIAAYLGGTLLGRHRLASRISPGKTVEGAAASLLGSSAAAWLVIGKLDVPSVEGAVQGPVAGPWGGWLCFGILVGLAAMAGDLAESLVKRECGAKDSGRFLGGLGGVLDLVDSLLFAAPVAWMLWVLGSQ